MDPNANLAEQRKVRRRLARTSLAAADRLSSLEYLCELTEAMDDWLSRGGFLPKDWDGPKPGSNARRRS